MVGERLDKGETIDLPLGKLLERLLTLKCIRNNVNLRANYRSSKGNNEPDETKATFFSKLLPTANKRMEALVSLVLRRRRRRRRRQVK